MPSSHTCPDMLARPATAAMAAAKSSVASASMHRVMRGARRAFDSERGDDVINRRRSITEMDAGSVKAQPLDG